MIPQNDREAISLIIDGLIAKGVKPTMSRDGAGEDLPYTDKDSALDWLTSCDDSVLFVSLPEGYVDPEQPEVKSSHIYFVLGNEPIEVACDSGVTLSPFLDPIVNPWWDR